MTAFAQSTRNAKKSYYIEINAHRVMTLYTYVKILSLALQLNMHTNFEVIYATSLHVLSPEEADCYYHNCNGKSI